MASSTFSLLHGPSRIPTPSDRKPMPMRSPSRLTHRRAVLLMVLVTLMWSIAGVVTRHLDAARGFEVTFWRSLCNAVGLFMALSVMRGPAFLRGLATARWPVWASGLCWATMFTAFMIALTLTSVANVLVIMALGPLVTALFARAFLGHRLPRRTWVAIVVAGVGIAWMYARQIGAGVSFVGSLVALAIPLAGAINFTTLQHAAHRRLSAEQYGEPTDMLPTVFIGAVISALATLPGWYQKLAAKAGAGTLVPITGFANSVVSPAIEFKAEGWVTGVGAKIFTIAGPVIAFGTLASFVWGVVYWLVGKVG